MGLQDGGAHDTIDVGEVFAGYFLRHIVGPNVFYFLK
jgi:hypothetical protein